MYYSASDKVVATAPAMAAAQPADQGANSGDVVNPDYTGSTAAAGSPAEYYDDDYYYASRLRRFHTPYRGSSLGYYDFAYTDPFWYGGSAYGYGSPYSPYGYYDPFYQPYYGYGGVSVIINIGRPWYRPFGYGYGYSPYDYYYNRPWGGYGGYGYGGYGYGGYGGYTGVNNYRPARQATYSGRRDRTGDGAGFTAADGATTTGRRRVQEGGFSAPQTNGVTSAGATQPGSRRRVQEPTTPSGTASTPEQLPETTLSGRRGRQVVDQADQPIQQLPAPTPDTRPEGRRWRVLDNSAGGTVATPTPGGQPDNPANNDYGRRRRADWNPGSVSSSPAPAPDQPRVADQPRRQRLFESAPAPASEPAPTYSEPRRSQPARTYSQPSRSESSGSYSAPSRSSGSSSGSGSGSSGGSSSGGGSRRR
ncbi:hypothetical protein D0T11_07000 [Hymenobacter rubripertinctus]|uniref:Uncharacterized protein n=2 Tax=Hymenobacter rubripertinctus TaxID=2029981 RepID=A0A418R2D5_9BACT|nr:hypothetical protein D0T11_07000 [Hymenobacter rubripertinctus]